MKLSKQTQWILLEYSSSQHLRQAIVDRPNKIIFYPAIGRLRVGKIVDVQVAIVGSDLLFPMRAKVIDLQQRPDGQQRPRGVYLKMSPFDEARFDRMCAFVDEVWKPFVRRSTRRHPVSMRASYYVPPFYYTAVTTNLSVNGMCLRTNGPLPLVDSGIYVKLHSSWLRPIELQTRVCWVDPNDSNRGIGLFCMGPRRGLKRLSATLTRMIWGTRS